MRGRWRGVMQQLWGWGSPAVATAVLTGGRGLLEGAHACAQSGEGQCPKGNSLGPGKGSGFRERKSSRQGWPGVGSQASPPRSGRLAPRGPWLGLGVGVHSLHSLTVKWGALGTLERPFAVIVTQKELCGCCSQSGGAAGRPGRPRGVPGCPGRGLVCEG